MNMDEVKLDITEQISKTNQAFTNYWGRLYVKGVLSDDTDSLENILKKVTKDFKFYSAISILLSAIVIIFWILKFFNITEFADMNKLGLIILFSIVSLTNTYRFYKVKINLENKIYLLGLLDKIKRM